MNIDSIQSRRSTSVAMKPLTNAFNRWLTSVRLLKSPSCLVQVPSMLYTQLLKLSTIRTRSRIYGKTRSLWHLALEVTIPLPFISLPERLAIPNLYAGPTCTPSYATANGTVQVAHAASFAVLVSTASRFWAGMAPGVLSWSPSDQGEFCFHLISRSS